MSRVRLAPDLEISQIITGLWQIADIERNEGVLNPDDVAPQMGAYAEAGLTTFDMADHYGSSEIIAGHFAKSQAPGSLQLLTKWVPAAGPITRDVVRKAVQTSLERLQTESIDLLQFHAWKYADASWLDGLYYLTELRREGLIRHLGVTNFDAIHLKMALDSGIHIVSNQICHSLLDRRAESNLAEVCRQHPVKLLAFGTLAGGFLTDKWLDKDEPAQDQLSTWSEMKYKRFIDAAGGWDVYQNLLQVTKSIATKYGASIANIASRYALQNPAVAAIIVGARLGKSEHIKENKRILKLNLDADDLSKIAEAQDHLTDIPGDCGDEYRRAPFLTASGDLSHHLTEMPLPYEPLDVRENRTQVFSGTPWEPMAGYCRAVRDGNRIHVSGTTATHRDKIIGGDDPASQTHFIIDKIEGAIESLGGSLSDVVRTRIFIHEVDDWEPVAHAHGQRFNQINPANTLVQARLIGEGYRVEIEAEAVVR